MREAKDAGFTVVQLYVEVSLETALRRNAERERTVPEHVPVWKSTSELGRRGQTSELSISAKSKSIRLIFGRIDCSHQELVLEARQKASRRNSRLRAH
jgi:predicted kinase